MPGASQGAALPQGHRAKEWSVPFFMSQHQLLDYLAHRLQEKNSIKQFVRMLVSSATYQQSSDFNFRRDIPGGLFLGQQRLRLEAEILRDNALAASGLLVSQVGGRSVFPYQPEGILAFRATPATWTESSGADRYRRGMYTHIWRLTPHPMFTLFDGPGMTTSCTRRTRSNVAVQALSLLNDPTFVEAAQAMGADFAYIGSPWIAASEANADEGYKKAIVDSSAEGIVYTNLFTGVHGNYLRSSIESAGLDPDNLPESDPSKMNFGSGGNSKAKAWKDIWGSGQGIGAVTRSAPVEETVARLEREYIAAKEALAKATA